MSQARQDGITLRQWLPLVGLTCCAFVFNTSEFMPIGLLTDIAASFSLTEAQAGIIDLGLCLGRHAAVAAAYGVCLAF